MDATPGETARFVEDLLGLMSPEEKLGQLDLFHAADDPNLEDALTAGRIGGIAGGGSATRAWQVCATQRAARGIPLLLTQPPQPAPLSPHALAAGWDEELARDLGRASAQLARSQGYNATAGPRMAMGPAAAAAPADIAASEPALAAALAAAWLEGASEIPGVAAIAGIASGSDEARLHVADALGRSGAARAIDAAGFGRRAAQRCGFGGIVVRECAAILSRIAAHRSGTMTLAEGAEAAIAAGTLDALRIESAVRGILATKHALGLFREPLPAPLGAPAPAADPAATARRTMVLLRNEAGLLPLSPVSDRVLVVGPGDGAARDAVEALSRAGIGRMAAPGLAMRRDGESWREPVAGDHFALALTRDAAKRADFAFVVLEDRHLLPAAGGAWPGLGAAARALLAALAPVGTRLVALLATATPVDLAEADAHFAAVLQCWRPGPGFVEALGDILSGRAGPQGRLPAAAGRYAFGQGLGYGEGVFGGFRAETTAEGIAAHLRVRNAGSFPARETVQFYAHRNEAPPRLVHFLQCTLQPGHERVVTTTIPFAALGPLAAADRGVVQLSAGKDQQRLLTIDIPLTPALTRAITGRGVGALRMAG